MAVVVAGGLVDCGTRGRNRWCAVGMDGGEGQREAEHDLDDQQVAELAVVGRDLEHAACLVADLPGHDEDFIQILGAELAE